MTQYQQHPERLAILREFEESRINVFDAIRKLDEFSCLDDKSRKDGGVVYTPKDVALRMCSLANPSLGDSALEPSSGRGVFVFALAMHHLNNGISPLDCCRALEHNLRACEIDPNAAADLQSLWLIFWR